MTQNPSRQLMLRLTALAVAAQLAAACGSSEPARPPVATPSLALSRDRAPAGSPLEMTYRFLVADDASFDQDYRVLVHVLDTDEDRMWGDDHEPPVPTSQWQPGQIVEYTRTVFVPIFPYIGEATITVGLYSVQDQTRLPLTGQHVGQNAYRVARLELLPQTDNLLTVFKDGWHPAELALDDSSLEWQWTKNEATLAFRNPRKDALFYLDVDSPGGEYVGTQQVQVLLGSHVVDGFTLEKNQRLLRKATLPVAHFGDDEMVELRITVDRTFVPARIPAAKNKDPRELGVRVFHAFVYPN